MGRKSKRVSEEIGDKVIYVTTTGIRISPFNRKKHDQFVKMNSAFDPVIKRAEPVSGFIIKDTKTFVSYKWKDNFLMPIFPDYRMVIEPPVNVARANKYSLSKEITLSDLQKSAESEFFGLNKPRSFINLQTGRGKTMVTVDILAKLGDKCLIMCPNTRVLDQWVETFKNYTDIDHNRIITVSGSQKFASLLGLEGNSKKTHKDYDVFLMTPLLLEAVAKQFGWDFVLLWFNMVGIGVKVYDEAHRNVKAMIHIDAYTNTPRTIYLSADFSQVSDQKKKLYYQIFWDVPVINPKHAANDLNYIKVITIDFNSKPKPMDELTIFNSRYGFDNHRYMDYQFDHDYIYNAINYIMDAISKTNQGYRILFLTSMKEHVNVVYGYISRNYLDYKVGRYHGDVPPEEKADTINNADVIISTYSSFGVGVDTKNIQYVVTLDEIDMITDNQAAGRARPIPGRYAFYFMVNDVGFKRNVNAMKKRISYLKESKAVSFYSKILK